VTNNDIIFPKGEIEMKLEYSGKNLLFETTALPDIFFTEYLSMASGDDIKVYLYMLFLSKYNKDIKISDLSKILSMPISNVQTSIKFWEDNNILIKKNNGYTLKSIQDITLNKLYKSKVTISPEKTENIAKNQYRARAIDSINTMFFQGVMAPTWYNDIEMWFDKYGFDEQVMISLFQYCFNKSAMHRNYILAVANTWQQNNVKTYSDLDAYSQKQDNFIKIKKNIAKKLGISRELTLFEDAYIEKWINEYGYNMNIIELALKRTTSKSNPSFDYINSLLTDWHDRNLVNPEDVEKYLNESKQRKKDVQNLQKKASISSSDRKYTNLDFLYANLSNSEAK